MNKLQGLPSESFVSRFKVKLREFPGGKELFERLEQSSCGAMFVLISLELHCGAGVESPRRTSIKDYRSRRESLAEEVDKLSRRLTKIAPKIERINSKVAQQLAPYVVPQRPEFSEIPRWRFVFVDNWLDPDTRDQGNPIRNRIDAIKKKFQPEPWVIEKGFREALEIHDALAQGRILSPLQAAEINAGRGDLLLHGSYVVSQGLAGPHYAACFDRSCAASQNRRTNVRRSAPLAAVPAPPVPDPRWTAR